MKIDMANHVHRDYSTPSRQQLREARTHREKLHDWYSEVQGHLGNIRDGYHAPSSSVDPTEFVAKLKEPPPLSEVPEEFKVKVPKLNPHTKVESRVKQHMLNEAYESVVSERPKPDSVTPQTIVDVERPLMLSWEATRVSPGRSRKDNKAESHYTTVFSKAAETEGQTASFLKPPEESRKKEVAEKREERLKKHIKLDKTRKQRILTVKPKKNATGPDGKPKKVAPDFVPRVHGLHDPSPGRKHLTEIQAQSEQRKRLHVDPSKPFFKVSVSPPKNVRALPDAPKGKKKPASAGKKVPETK